VSEALCFLSIADAARQIAARSLSPVELAEAHLARIAALDPQLDSYLTVTAEQARTQARRAEAELAAGRSRGPLHGIPFGLKDMFETAGIRTTAQSRVLRDHVPVADATAVRQLYTAGAVLLGKHTTHEFAHGGPSFDLPWPPARNPWNPAHYTGGSSSGSAAAVAAGLAMGALGTDTGGSVRSPCFLCATVGIKPTFGLISRAGVVPFSASCDHVGPITRTVEDGALLLQALVGADAADAGSTPAPHVDYRGALTGDIRGARIGAIRHFWEDDAPANPEQRAALDQAIAVLRQLGATVEDVRLRTLHEYYAVRILLTESELFARHQHNLRTRPHDYGHHFLGRILGAALFTGADYIAAQRQRRAMIAEMAPLYARYDVFLLAGAGPAPPLSAHRSIGSIEKWLTPSMGTLFSVVGGPAIALPCGFSARGLPIGFQLGGRPFDDATVLRVAHAYEQAAGWHRRHPVLDPGAARIAIDLDAEAPPKPAPLDGATRDQVRMLAVRAGLMLDDELFDLMCQTAPYALAFCERVRRDQAWSAEQAAVFRLSVDGEAG